MDAMIQIGGFDSKGVSDMADSVIKVATCSEDALVVEKALDTLARLVEATPSPTNTNISNCQFTSSPARATRPPVKKV